MLRKLLVLHLDALAKFDCLHDVILQMLLLREFYQVMDNGVLFVKPLCGPSRIRKDQSRTTAGGDRVAMQIERMGGMEDVNDFCSSTTVSAALPFLGNNCSRACPFFLSLAEEMPLSTRPR